MLGTLWCTQSKFGWDCWQTPKKRFLCGFSGGRMRIQPLACDSRRRSKRKTTNTEKFMIMLHLQTMLSCRLTRSFVKRSDPFGLLLTTKRGTPAYTNMHKGFLFFFFFPTGWTEHHLQGCDGMHTSTRLWCKTRTVWNANHGEKGERGEERSFFTVESIYIMLLFVSLNRVLLWRGTPMRAVMGNISPALKQAAAATRTEWLPLLPLHQLSSSCE